MTHQDFRKLHDASLLALKIYKGNIDGEDRTVEAFEWDGKYYLRIHKVFRYVTGQRSNGKRYKMARESHIIKEFDSKAQANNYFKKVADGQLRRIV